MRILIVNYRYFVSGGPERYMFGVSRLFEDAGHEVAPFSVRYRDNVPTPWARYFVRPIAGENEVYFSQHSWSPATVRRGLERAFYSREVYGALRRLIDDWRPDVALVMHYLRKLSPAVLVALRDAGVPVVVRLSDFQMVCPEGHLTRDGRICEECVGQDLRASVRYRCVQGSLAASAVNAAAVAYARRRRFFDSVDRYLAPSRMMQRQMIAGGFAAGAIVQIPTFVRKVDAGELRVGHRASGDGAARRICYVGRIDAQKGVEVLVDAFARLAAAPRHRDLELCIVGDATTEEGRRLVASVQARGVPRVVFAGRLDADGVSGALRDSLLSVVPSLGYENLPNALLESLACGTPVVGSNHGSVAEVLGGTQAGLLFTPGDATDLVRMLDELLADSRRLADMGVAAQALAETRYSPEAHLSALLRVFHEVRAEHGLAPEGGVA